MNISLSLSLFQLIISWRRWDHPHSPTQTCCRYKLLSTFNTLGRFQSQWLNFNSKALFAQCQLMLSIQTEIKTGVQTCFPNYVLYYTLCTMSSSNPSEWIIEGSYCLKWSIWTFFLLTKTCYLGKLLPGNPLPSRWQIVSNAWKVMLALAEYNEKKTHNVNSFSKTIVR